MMLRWRVAHPIALSGPLAVVLVSTLACSPRRADPPAPATALRDALIQLARGEGDLAALTVTFDHLDAFHGGFRLTIRGDGTIQQQAVRTEVGDPRDKVTPNDLKELVTRLVKHEAWAQRIDERQPVPDESRATLETCYGDECVEIWEWYNDLEKNARIGDVLKSMQAIAWKPTAPSG